jgi:hypothetical protein
MAAGNGGFAQACAFLVRFFGDELWLQAHSAVRVAAASSEGVRRSQPWEAHRGLSTGRSST